MKPPPFEYHDPADLDAAAKLLADLGAGARILAGGQSLIPMLNLRVAMPEHLIDLRRVPGLAGVRLEGSRLVIGAMTTHRTVETSAVVRSSIPLLSEAAGNVAHIPIRERGTLGGSLSLADPTAEMPMVSALLGAEITVRSIRGERVIPATNFIHSAMTTDLADDEILTSVSYPLPEAGTASAFTEYARRSGDLAIVGAAAIVGVRDGRYGSIRVGLCGAHGKPFVSSVAAGLAGETADDDTATRLADAVAAELAPIEDIRATAEDRRDIARALVRRAVVTATRRASPVAAKS